MTHVAAIGPLSIDVVGEGRPRPGGTAFYAGLTFDRLGADAHVALSCAAGDRGALEALGVPVYWYESAETTAFRFRYTRGGRRVMRVEAVGEPWQPERALEAAGDARWIQVGGLLRTDFPEKTLAALAGSGATLLVDAQGLVRRARLGRLQNAAGVGEALRYATILKLDLEEAETLAGEPDPVRLQRLGVPEIVFTMGARGAVVITPTRFDPVPAADVGPSVDPTGAGDTLSAAYLVARSGGAEPLEALRSASDVVARFLSKE